MKRFLLVILFLTGIAGTASAQEAWCTANPNNCVCSETFQGTAYTRAVDFGNGGGFLSTQTNSKHCRIEGFDMSIQSVFGGNNFDDSLAIGTDSSMLALLPRRDATKVQRYIRHKGGQFGGGGGQNSTYRFGMMNMALGSARRLSMRWYVYYSTDFQIAFMGTCNNGKIANSCADDGTGPTLRVTWLDGQTNGTGGSMHSYAFAGGANGWVCPTCVSGFEGFTNGPRGGASAQTFTNLRGKWLRFELVVRHPRAADAGPPGNNGYDYELWVTDVTNQAAPVQELRMSAGCTNCLHPGPVSFPAGTLAYPIADMDDLHTEYYRSTLSGGTCMGWQAWMYAAVAKWDTDSGQMIGPASEVEGGSGGPVDTTAPAKPTGVRVL